MCLYAYFTVLHNAPMAKASGRAQRSASGVPDTLPMLPPLVEAKLAAPSLRSGLIDRPRIRRMLDAGGDVALTLVAAPAGYGKTTAVRMWCAGLDDAVAWVTLDADDNDPLGSGDTWRRQWTACGKAWAGLPFGDSTHRPVRSRALSTSFSTA